MTGTPGAPACVRADRASARDDVGEMGASLRTSTVSWGTQCVLLLHWAIWCYSGVCIRNRCLFRAAYQPSVILRRGGLLTKVSDVDR